MKSKPKNNSKEKNEENILKKKLNTNNVNKNKVNKETIRKQKRLFQMQKRLALFNEEDPPELESENNIITKVETNTLNNIEFHKNLGQNHKEIKTNYNRTNLSFNNNLLNEKLNIDKIHHKKSHEKKNSKNNLEQIINQNLEQELEQQNLKEEEISLKKKNTYSNTNDEDKTSTEALFPNENELNRKKSKTFFQNDSIEKDVLTNVINGDIDENPNIFSGSNVNNEIEDENVIKEEIDFQNNLFNNFDFQNLINDEDNDNSKDGNLENDNSLIINETDQENNINENNEEDNKKEENKEDNKEVNNEDSNVELNISNLELDINDINEDDNTQNEESLTMLGPNSNEFAKKYLSSKSKSFIKFNNNLTARVAADSLKNSLSYMLALCPELMDGVDKKTLLKENYTAIDVISEDIEAENLTPRNTEKEELPINKLNDEKRKDNNNNNEYLSNKTLRNKKNKSPVDNKKKGNISPKTHYKNKSKIDKNTFNDIPDLENDFQKITKQKKKIISSKTKTIYSNKKNDNNNFLYENYNTNNDKYRNSTIKINDNNIKIKIRHQKAKSSVNNQTELLNLNFNINIKNKQHSPKQTNEIFSKKNTINKITYKNLDKKKKKSNIQIDNDAEHVSFKQNYLSNESNKKSHQKFVKREYSNTNNNTMIKSHNYCKSDLRDKIIDIKKKFTFLRRNNAMDLSQSNNYFHKKIINNDNNNICFTEKNNKTRDNINFISHRKKNTPDNDTNISEQNINHSKKLSQQISDGYTFFMNSINNNNHNNRYTDSKNNIKRKRIGSNNFSTKSSSLSNYFSFHQNNANNNNYSNNVTFIKKTTTIKEEKIARIFPNHNKSKTSFITPSYQNLNQTKNRLLKKNFTLLNSNKSKKASEISSKNIKKNYVKKINNNNKFNKIKKIVNDSSVKIIHKKINTIGQSNELTKLLNNNSNIGINKQLKDSSSYSNYNKNFNKHKIIMALQHIKFSPVTNYSKVLNELYKNKKNLFVILVYTDSIKRFIFRGIYEVNSYDHKTANKLFAPGFGQNKLNAARLNNFFDYQSNNAEFVRIKFNNDNDKKFRDDTIIVY